MAGQISVKINMRGDNSSQPLALCLNEEVSDGGGVPACSSAWGSFVHGLELGGDLLEGVVWCRGLDAGDEADEPVVPSLRPCALKQAGLDEAFRGQPPHGAAEALHGPATVAAAVENPDDVAPGLGATGFTHLAELR